MRSGVLRAAPHPSWWHKAAFRPGSCGLGSRHGSPSGVCGPRACPALQPADLPALLVALLSLVHVAAIYPRRRSSNIFFILSYGSFTSMPFIEHAENAVLSKL